MRASPEILRLLAFDPSANRRLRCAPGFHKLRADLADEREHGALEPEDLLASDQGEIFGVLSRAEPTPAPALVELLSSAARADGKLVPPLAVVAGELALPFDELARLRVAAGVVASLGTEDPVLKAAVGLVTDVLATPRVSGATGVEALTTRLREAAAQAKPALARETFDALVDKALLANRRATQTRVVFGGTHVRGVLAPEGAAPGATELVPAYFSETLGDALPSFHRLRVRLLVEVHPRVDTGETHAVALRVLGAAQVVVLPARK